MPYYIKRVRTPGGDGYALVDEAGEMVPHQVETTLKTVADALPEFTVTFRAGQAGLQVIDERDE